MTSKLMALSLVSFMSFSVLAADPCINVTGCAHKSCEIEQQILMAEKAKNKRQVEGLNKALTAVKRDCTEDKLLREKADKIEEKSKEVAERTKELDEAKLSGKKDKIKQKEMKLQEATKELDELRASSL